ncbi:hypothetical protein [Lentzea flaviverrucosa]|uniref:Uncharacterized protein n=1 Tax=Lentzea flaviverrucosa TaxID=200379 RepID=A0A1H9B8B6_9PSEU|nr:hypothetical protein [Lentzea flaviverrucosa]RDI31860.1 hypothetical protein DFR72_103260 [Lentzea flaviverrucosa]SEP84913.1 hypothetical protein SAMN05216195_101398 [Lentzea flaviverrucosa]
MSKTGDVRACAAGPGVVLDVQAACQPHKQNPQAPIDNYYEAAEAITLVGQLELLEQSPVLGRLLLLGHVSAAETFLRAILVGLLNVCPLSRAHAGTQMVPFASLGYYGEEEVAYGLFDGTSLAGAGEVKKAVKKLTDIDVQTSGACNDVLNKFDQLCHLRHAAVHAHGSIGTANATALGVVSSSGRLSLEINLARLHEAAMICRSFAQEINQVLFIRTFERWRNAGLLTRDYPVDQATFSKLYSLFRSKKDSESKSLAPRAAYDALFS